MNIRIVNVLAIFVTTFMVLCGVSNVLAKTKIVPGGPWVTDNQNVSLERLNDYPQLVKKLKQIEKTSKGLVELEIIGDTNEGRNVYLAKIGNPDNEAVMIITQQHGNEAFTTEAALKLIQKLSAGSN